MNIELVPPLVEYAERFFQWRNEPLTLKFNPVKRLSLAELQDVLRDSPKSLKPLETAKAHRWFIKMDGELVGTVSLSEINDMMGTAEIGYMIGEAFRGRGLATAAVKKWTSMIFSLTDIRKLTATVAAGNTASLRVLEKAGYKREGLLREHYLIEGIPTDEVMFGQLRNEIP